MHPLLADVAPDAAGAGVAIGILLISLVVMVISLALFVISILSIIDTTKHSDQAFVAAGTTKQTALIISILGLVICGVLGAYYWWGIKPKVIAAEQNMGLTS